MELLNVLKAQSTWLFDVNDLNPRGKFFLPEMLDWFRERYNFLKAPSSVTDLDETKGLAFKHGSFHLGSDQLVVEVTIYNDGLLANSYSSTQATDIFLDDALCTAAQEFQLNYRDTMIRYKHHLSEVTARFDHSLMQLTPKLTAFAEKITAVHEHHRIFEFTGILWGPDNSESAFKTPSFIVERKVGAPFSENRYYSKAPLHTDQHLALLGELDNLLVP
jgi:hypothetical protein